ncbi:hypothetical protein BB934_45460 (plasmid) [Microvirga ossetica]|uniref:Uncharacterized protein n=1 Tax=Microvirga ossetica TaxID=1882682 RepID=A0A1B2EZQ1_9HYPH|nr:hypothetical protein [Microvirga ossetica]ANY85470.1 hypothetical protein BB934_45460 [Microvirga ossetica]
MSGMRAIKPGTKPEDVFYEAQWAGNLAGAAAILRPGKSPNLTLVRAMNNLGFAEYRATFNGATRPVAPFLNTWNAASTGFPWGEVVMVDRVAFFLSTEEIRSYRKRLLEIEAETQSELQGRKIKPAGTPRKRTRNVTKQAA